MIDRLYEEVLVPVNPNKVLGLNIAGLGNTAVSCSHVFGLSGRSFIPVH